MTTLLIHHKMENSKLEHFIYSAHNYNFIQIKTHCILSLAIQSSCRSWETMASHMSIHSSETLGTVRVHIIVCFMID